MKKPVLVSSLLAAAVLIAVVLIMSLPKKVPAPPRAGADRPAAAPEATRGEAVEKGPGPEGGEAAQPAEPARSSPEERTSSVLTGLVLEEGTLRPIRGAMVRALQLDDAPLLSIVADGKGQFRLEGLPYAPLRLRASAAGHLDTEVPSIFPGEEAHLLLARQEGVPCVVAADREEGEQPLPRQRVVLEIETRGWTFDATTDDGGRLSITGVDRADFESARSSGDLDVAVPGFAQVQILKAEAGNGYKILVEPGATVEGFVIDGRTGKPIPHARVHAETGQEVEADELGAYRIAGVDEDLTAYAPGYSIRTQELDDHEVDEKLRMDFRLVRGLTLKGRVKDARGQPIASVRVTIARDELDLDSGSEKLEERLREMLVSVSGNDGQYRLEGLSRPALELPGSIDLECGLPGLHGGVSREVEIEVDHGEVEHDLVLDLQLTLNGSVKTSTGGPVPHAGVILESAVDDLSAVAGTGPDGRFQLKNLPLGQYRVRVERDARTVHSSEVTLPVGELSLALDTLAAVSGVVLAEGSNEPLPGLLVTLHAAPGLGPPVAAETVTDSSGRFSITDVPRGSHVLRVSPRERVEPFSRFARDHRQPIDVAEGGWSGDVRYPVPTWGEVVLAFSVADPNGVATPAEGSVSVSVASFRLGGETTSFPAIGDPRIVQDARQGFEARWRDGEYRLRCSITIDGTELVMDEELTLAPGGKVERTVTFQRRK